VTFRQEGPGPAFALPSWTRPATPPPDDTGRAVEAQASLPAVFVPYR
jgi:hypothetical protein